MRKKKRKLTAAKPKPHDSRVAAYYRFMDPSTENDMAVSRNSSKKAPSQQPNDFFKCQQQGGTHGKAQRVGDKLTGGPMLEQIYGRKDLGKQ